MIEAKQINFYNPHELTVDILYAPELPIIRDEEGLIVPSTTPKLFQIIISKGNENIIGIKFKELEFLYFIRALTKALNGGENPPSS